MIRVARLTASKDAWKLLGSYRTYDEADEALEAFCERFPNAYIDILDGSLANVKTI
jgi:hypothetical protein